MGTDMLKLTLGKRKRWVLGNVGKDKGKGIGFQVIVYGILGIG